MTIQRRTALAATLLAAAALGLPSISLAQKKLVLGFSQVGAESGWRTANTESIKSAAKEAGIELTPAGSTHPYRKDPEDRVIRIAPTFPELAEVTRRTNEVRSEGEAIEQEMRSEVKAARKEAEVSAREIVRWVWVVVMETGPFGRASGCEQVASGQLDDVDGAAAEDRQRRQIAVRRVEIDEGAGLGGAT